MDKRETKILKVSDRMFGLSSIDSICKERINLFSKMKRFMDSEDGMILIASNRFLEMYSRYITLNRLYRLYTEEKR